MSDFSNSKNEALSESANITGSSSLISSTSSSSTRATAPRDRTPDHLSGLSDVPFQSDPITPIIRGQEGTAQLEEILRVGPGTRPDRWFIEDLNGVAQAQPAPVVDLTADVGEVPERAASQASTSGREDSQGSESSAPSGEPIQARQRPPGRAMRINDQQVYRSADQEMVGLAEEFRIPDNVDLVVPDENNLPSRPPPGYIMLSSEYFRAGLRLPFHTYLRRALHRLNVAQAQLNVNAYRILISCFILWTKHFTAKLPFRAFQNLYRMKSAPSSSGFYYFQGFKGTFIMGCPDSDKQFKHLWFYAGGRRGYVWTRALHIPEMTLAKVEALRELSDLERNQQGLLSRSSLEGHSWFGSSSTSGHAVDQPRSSRPGEVAIARMPEPAVHYRSRTSDTDTATTPDRSDEQSPGTWGPWVTDEDMDLVIWGLFPARGLLIEEPMADCQPRGTKRPSEEERRLLKMAKLGKDKGKAGTSAADPPSRGVRLPAAPATKVMTTPLAPAPQAALPPAPRPSDRSESRSSRPRDDWQPAAPASRSHREDSRPRDVSTSEDELARQKSTHKAFVSKFGEKLTHKVVESSKRSDPEVAFNDCAEKLIEVSGNAWPSLSSRLLPYLINFCCQGLCLALAVNVAARGYANRMADEVKSAEAETQSARQAEKDAKAARDAAKEAQKKVEARAKFAEDRSKSAKEWARIAETDASNGEIVRCGMEEALRKAESDLASAQAEHDRYVKVALPAALEEARAQAVEDFQQSEDFNSWLVHEYQEGMRDMKTGFTAVNPSLVGVDWSFVPAESEEGPAESEETVAEEVPEEGEVSGAARVSKDVVVLDDPEEPAAPEQPVVSEQPATLEQPVAPEQPPSEQPGFSLPDQLD
ncbi:hypothetical protein TIFTF001_028901 [Ficus carica]|uniref:Uncharacterized protein n=1 Tax=Ficus carica TaxID=3494 RepID=A0AA88DTM0_FICCA|nr:hypothetical protein TIFTF001_028901 [Ficus carica]